MTIPLPGIALADHAPWVRRLVEYGYTDLWTMETDGFDAFTPLACAAVWAPELRLGTAIASVFTRGPALLAQQAAALADAAPGRFVLGLGASSPVMVRDWNGLPFEAPYARVRDTLAFLRAALAGERVDARFASFESRGFALARVPRPAPPIYLAALQRDMHRLAARRADGVLLSLVAAADVPALRAQAETGPAAGAPRDVVLRIGVVPTADAARARDHCRRLLAAYLNVPAYAAMHTALGRGDALAPMWGAWRAGDRRRALGLVPDALVDALFVHGEPAACRAQIEAFVAAGVTTPVLSVMPVEGVALDLRRTLQDLAPR
jgi:probable F420-dependent oxidoreductase